MTRERWKILRKFAPWRTSWRPATGLFIGDCPRTPPAECTLTRLVGRRSPAVARGPPPLPPEVAAAVYSREVAALDVLDSFGARTVCDVAEMARLRGAKPVIVGIQPHVAYSMASLGLGTGSIPTAQDLEDGLRLLDQPPSVTAI